MEDYILQAQEVLFYLTRLFLWKSPINQPMITTAI